MLGGAFDPPHMTHVAMARCAVQNLGVSELRVVPTGLAWHKHRPLTESVHRLAMTRLAFADVPRTVVDTIEIDRGTRSYTIDTLQLWHQQWPQARLVLLLGADQAETLTTWKEWVELFRLATIYVAPRAGYSGASTATDMPSAYRDQLQLLPVSVTDHSATSVRDRVAHGYSVDGLVPSVVARYIADHHLYTTS